MTAGIVVLVIVGVLCLVFAVHRARTDGRVRQATPAAEGASRPVVTAAEVGTELGERATFLQFSSAFCAPCRATRQVLGDALGEAPGVAHVEVDAESHLELVRRLDVRRTPTVLVLDRSGAVLGTVKGVPRRDEVHAAVRALPGP